MTNRVRPPPKTWYQEGSEGYMLSTDPNLVDLHAVNDMFASETMWWAKRLDEDKLRMIADNSLFLGLYVLPGSTRDIAGRSNPKMIGLARMITDYSTFAWLTDVYIVPSHQGSGLGRWMIECLDEMLGEWPDLRRTMWLASDPKIIEFYRKIMGAHVFGEEGKNPETLRIMEKQGPGVGKMNH